MLSYDDSTSSVSSLATDPIPAVGEKWITAAALWALIIAVFGSAGNFLTALTIIHQIILQRRRQNMYSPSDSNIQLKIIKEKENSNCSLSAIEKSNVNHKQIGERSVSLSPCHYNVQSHPPSPIDTLSPIVERLKNDITFSKIALIERNSLPLNFVFREKCEQYVGEQSQANRFIPVKNVCANKPFVKEIEDVHSNRTSSSSKSSRENSPNINSPASSLAGKNSPNEDISINIDPYSPSMIEKSSLSTTSSQIIYKHHHGHQYNGRSTSSVRSQLSSQCRPEHGGTTQPTVMHVEGDTLLLLHVIICDFLYCFISLSHNYYVYGFRGPGIPVMCAEAAFLRYVNAFAEWLTLGLLTLQRCVDLAKPPNARFFRFKSTLSFVAATWIFSIFLQLGNLINGNFGYDSDTRKCDIVGPMTSKLYFYTLDTFLPSGLMLFGCISIISQIVRNKRRLQRFGMSSDIVAQREKEMWQSAFLILSLLFLYLACVIPICVYNVLFTLNKIESEETGIVVYMIYWVQYGLNFIAYGTRRSQFRKAFKIFFMMIFDKIKYCCRFTDIENKGT